MRVLYSRHAREQMVERGISEREVDEAIRSGSKSLQEPDKILFSHKYYCVVCRKTGDALYVITVKPRW